MEKKNIIEEDYINPEQMDKPGSFFFDLMIVAGIAAIQLDLLKDYWPTVWNAYRNCKYRRHSSP